MQHHIVDHMTKGPISYNICEIGPFLYDRRYDTIDVIDLITYSVNAYSSLLLLFQIYSTSFLNTHYTACTST